MTYRLLATGLLAASIVAASSICAADTSGTIPTTIKAAPADENTETSSAISAILDRCAEVYAKAPAMHATATYVRAAKSDGVTTYTSAKVKLDYIRPDKLAIVTTSDSDPLDNGFYADGTTNTQVFANNKNYVILPQPELGSFAATWRAGEIHRDFSDALSMSGIGSLLIAESPAEWIHSNVVRYVYEGAEEVAGNDCHRIRFNQENPDVIVVLWIDKKSFLVRKLSFIHSYDDDYEMVESFEEGTEASMRLVNFDTISLRPADVPKSAFRARIPKGYTLTKDEPATSTESTASLGFWGNLVRNAALSSPEETTWSLTRSSGDIDLKLEEFVNTPKPVIDLDPDLSNDGKISAMGLAMDGGLLHFYHYDGTLSSTVTLKEGIRLFAWQEKLTSGPRLLAVDKHYQNLNAYTLSGDKLWSYHLPFSVIETLRGAQPPEEGTYLDMGELGLRKIGPEGQVLFANSSVAYPGQPNPAPPGIDRLISNSGYSVTILDKQLHKLHEFETDELISATWWDKEDAANPLISLSITDDYDILLQRRNLKGDIIWTTNVEPKATAEGGAMSLLATLQVQGKPQEVIIVLMGHGKVAIADKSGKIIYRGKVDANDSLVERNESTVLRFFLVADVNNDGLDEIYFPLDTHMMRLKTE